VKTGHCFTVRAALFDLKARAITLGWAALAHWRRPNQAARPSHCSAQIYLFIRCVVDDSGDADAGLRYFERGLILVRANGKSAVPFERRF